MKKGWRRSIFASMGAVLACLLGVVTAGSQTPPAQNPQASPQMVEEVFKNVALLRGIPVDTFFETMGMFASSMGDDCTFCHAKEAAFKKELFAQPTPLIMRARQMIAMVNGLNKTYFAGQPRVSCYTCHRGSSAPVVSPNLAIQYGAPIDDPNVMDFPPDTRMSADQVFDRYIAALGGAESVAKLSSFVAKGTYAGFDTATAEVPAEIFASAPNRRTMIVHMFNGDSFRVFDGSNGWLAGPDSPTPLLTLSAGNLERARTEAILAFPAGIKQAFSQWRVGRTSIEDQDVQVLQGTSAGQLPANLYFDKAGLLVRLVRWTATPLGPVPTQIDYSDYRPVAGVRMPFHWTVSQTYMQMTVQLSEVQPNAPIDASRFVRPAPARR
jgi:hypothetical protein